MSKSMSEWLQEGDEVYQGSVEEYRQIEEQLRELAAKWRAKRADINKLAGILGKAPLADEPGDEAAAEGHVEEARGHAPRMNVGGPAVRR